MKKIVTYTFAAIFILLVASSASAAGPPAVGATLPDIKLSVPQDSASKTYLDLGYFAFGSFRIPEIKAQLVIIEIFSMYCPYCQREAPNVNDLFARIERDPALKGKIKIIGIGAGNTSYEVGVFKKQYNVPFPLFADGDLAIHKMLGEVRTPYFIGVRIEPDGSHRVIYSKVGAFDGAENFLSTLIRLSGLK